MGEVGPFYLRGMNSNVSYPVGEILPPCKAGEGYAHTVPLKFGGVVPLVNVITGEQCPNSGVCRSVNFEGNPGLTAVREEAGISDIELLERSVWLTPMEITVLKMSQIRRRKGYEARLNEKLRMRKQMRIVDDEEALTVLLFLIGQYQPYFKKGKATHLKHPLGYRTCYKHLAEELGWEDTGQALKKRMRRIFRKLEALGFIERQIVKTMFTRNKVWRNVTFLRVVPENLFPILDPKGYKTRKACMEGMDGNSLFVMMNHRTLSTVAASDRRRIGHLFGPRTIGRMDAVKLYGDPTFKADTSEFPEVGSSISTKSFFDSFESVTTNGVLTGKVMNAHNIYSHSGQAEECLHDTMSIHSKNKKRNRVPRSPSQSLFVFREECCDEMTYVNKSPSALLQFLPRGHDYGFRDAWNNSAGMLAYHSNHSYSCRSRAHRLDWYEETPGDKKEPLSSERKEQIVAAITAFHPHVSPESLHAQLSEIKNFRRGECLNLDIPKASLPKAAAFLGNPKEVVPASPGRASKLLDTLYHTAVFAEIQSHGKYFFEGISSSGYSFEDMRNYRSDRPSDEMLKAKKLPMGVFFPGKTTRLNRHKYQETSLEAALSVDPDAFFLCRDVAYRKFKKIPNSKAGAGRKDPKTGEKKIDPSYQNHFWNWKPWYSTQLRLVRIARYIKQNESDFMLLRSFFGADLAGATARPEFACQFYQFHRTGKLASHTLHELAFSSSWKSPLGASKSYWLSCFLCSPKKFLWQWTNRWDNHFEERKEEYVFQDEMATAAGPVRFYCSPCYVGDASKFMEDFGRCEGYFHSRIWQMGCMPLEVRPIDSWDKKERMYWAEDRCCDPDETPIPKEEPVMEQLQREMPKNKFYWEYAWRLWGKIKSIRENTRGAFTYRPPLELEPEIT